MPNNKLILRSTASPYTFPYSDIVIGSVLSWDNVDNNFIFLKGLGVKDGSYDSGSSIITLNRIDGSTISISGITSGSGSSGTDVYVTGGTYAGGTAIFTNTTGGTFNVTGFNTSGGSGDNTYTTGGTCNNGVFEFTNSTGGTFSVTACTDVSITGGTASGDTIEFTNNTGGTFSVTGITGSGVTTPSGTNTQVQFNDSGSFGASTGLTFNPTTGVFSVNSENGVYSNDIHIGTGHLLGIPFSGNSMRYGDSSGAEVVLNMGNLTNLGGTQHAGVFGYLSGDTANIYESTEASSRLLSSSGIMTTTFTQEASGSTISLATGGTAEFKVIRSGIEIFSVNSGGTTTQDLQVNGEVAFSGTTTGTTATAGAATLPANPVGFMTVTIDGTDYKMPYYNT